MITIVKNTDSQPEAIERLNSMMTHLLTLLLALGRGGAVAMAVATTAAFAEVQPDNPAEARAEASATHWPCYLGPNGSFTESSGVRLVDDLSQARLLWASEVKDIGPGKVSGKPSLGAKYRLPAAGAASPIVSGRLVIQAYFIPRGILAVEFPQGRSEFSIEKPQVTTTIGE
jgi:hypothetical protein